LLPKSAADTSPPTLCQLSAELKDFEKWYLLGLQLEINKDTLDSIEKSHVTKGRQCVEMLQHWISSLNNPKWETVHEALRNVGESIIAAKIAEKYHVQPRSINEEKTLKPDSKHLSNSEEISTVKSKPIIRREQWRISTYFGTVLHLIIEILENEVKPDKLMQYLRLQCHPLNPEALYVDKKNTTTYQ